ncbi:MAG: 3-hydroxyacyl-CoA dehydrogenase [Hyphomicrobiaceae bacterium]
MATCGVIGAGLIGRAWAMVFARAGWNVQITDVSEAARMAAPKLLADALADQARHGLVEDASRCLTRIKVVATLDDAVKGVDFVQECGPETVEAKIALFQKLDAAAPADAILSSSSSAIVASKYTENLKGRARCLVGHPVNPPHLVPIVELCPSPWTAPETMTRARAIYDEIGQVPITVNREIEGFILNRLQGALLAEAFRLVEDGVVSAEDLDKTICEGLGLRWSFMGPFETIDLNAPGGIADYCERYTGFYKRLQADPAKPAVYEKAETDKIVSGWGEGAKPGPDHAAKSRWRDERLAALAAFKRNQKPFKS